MTFVLKNVNAGEGKGYDYDPKFALNGNTDCFLHTHAAKKVKTLGSSNNQIPIFVVLLRINQFNFHNSQCQN